MSSIYEDMAAQERKPGSQSTSSFSVNQLKDQIVAKAQGLPEYTNLPPQARGLLNEALVAGTDKLGGNFVNDLDTTAAGVLNKVPAGLIGPNNPMDLISGNLDQSDLAGSLNLDLDIGYLAGKFKGLLTNEVINGDVSANQRASIINRFQNQDEPKVLVIQPQSASHGVTLTRADTVVFWSPVMSVEVYLQCVARMDRVGQKNKMTVVHLQGSDVEKRMYAMLQGKVDQHTKLVDLYREELES